jgi:hypothetical protein
VSRSVDNFAQAFDLGEDRFCDSGPHEGSGMLIVMLDERVDLALQVSHRIERAARDGLIGDQREPTLNLVEPGRVGRGEVQVEA